MVDGWWVDNMTPSSHDRGGGSDREWRVIWRMRVVKSKLGELS